MILHKMIFYVNIFVILLIIAYYYSNILRILYRNPNIISCYFKFNFKKLINHFRVTKQQTLKIIHHEKFYSIELSDTGKKIIIPINNINNWSYYSSKYKIIVNNEEYDNLSGQKHILLPKDVGTDFLTIKNIETGNLVDITGSTIEEIEEGIKIFIDNDF